MCDTDKVAIAILNWNGAEMLRRFLPSVLQHSSSCGAKVYVADNGSTDNSLEVLYSEFPEVNVIRFTDNHGFAEGYNKVMAVVDSEYVVLLNSDVEVTEGWIEPIIELMDSDVQIAACQPKILSFKDKLCFEYAGAAGGYIDRYGYPFCRGRIFDTVERDEGQYNIAAEVFWASGAAMFVRREAYLAVGGLDARFFAHMEEIDLCWRLNARGYKLMCVPQSKVYHVGGATLKKENPKKTYLNFRNNLLMLYKNLPDLELSSVMRVRMFLDYIAALVFALKFDFPNMKAVLKARSDFNTMKRGFTTARNENLAKSVKCDVMGKYGFSIIWKSKFCGCNKFSRL